jgi:hypothetical protein
MAQFGVGKAFDFELNSMSSWSRSLSVANRFGGAAGGVVLESRIPLNRIFAVGHLHAFWFPSEAAEYVIIGGKAIPARILDVNTARTMMTRQQQAMLRRLGWLSRYLSERKERSVSTDREAFDDLDDLEEPIESASFWSDEGNHPGPDAPVFRESELSAENQNWLHGLRKQRNSRRSEV